MADLRLIKLLTDDKYRREQFSTDKKSLQLILIGIPVGILVLVILLKLLNVIL
jgi:hypothetical protein